MFTNDACIIQDYLYLHVVCTEESLHIGAGKSPAGQ